MLIRQNNAKNTKAVHSSAIHRNSTYSSSTGTCYKLTMASARLVRWFCFRFYQSELKTSEWILIKYTCMIARSLININE